MNKKTFRFIAITQSFYGFMILMVKYMINGLANIQAGLFIKDVIFIIFATMYIIAFTILVYSGIYGLIGSFKGKPKKEQKEENKK